MSSHRKISKKLQSRERKVQNGTFYMLSIMEISKRAYELINDSEWTGRVDTHFTRLVLSGEGEKDGIVKV